MKTNILHKKKLFEIHNTAINFCISNKLRTFILLKYNNHCLSLNSIMPKLKISIDHIKKKTVFKNPIIK